MLTTLKPLFSGTGDLGATVHINSSDEDGGTEYATIDIPLNNRNWAVRGEEDLVVSDDNKSTFYVWEEYGGLESPKTKITVNIANGAA